MVLGDMLRLILPVIMFSRWSKILRMVFDEVTVSETEEDKTPHFVEEGSGM